MIETDYAFITEDREVPSVDWSWLRTAIHPLERNPDTRPPVQMEDKDGKVTTMYTPGQALRLGKFIEEHVDDILRESRPLPHEELTAETHREKLHKFLIKSKNWLLNAAQHKQRVLVVELPVDEIQITIDRTKPANQI